MEVPTWEVSSLLADNEPLTEEQFAEMEDYLKQGEFQQVQFTGVLSNAIAERAGDLEKDTTLALKVAQGYYALAQYKDALSWLDKAGDGKQQTYLKACSLKELGQYDDAIAQFQQAEGKGCDSFDMAIAVVECLRLADKLDEAAENLNKLSRVGDIRADYHFQMGRLHDANGKHEAAIAEYEQAITLDSSHSKALFHLAYACDLYGLEDDAMEYYQQCIMGNSAPVSALLNLAVLYEDNENYHGALQCVRKVLTAYPNHKRAQIYLKDIEASTTMYYDEDQERRIDRRNKVLEIPISDFELSVRSRNCLKKMNIRTLGDLLKVTEPELLAYKNFGETSLQEIKAILTSKGLRLGQMLEEHKNGLKAVPVAETADEEVDEGLKLPVNQLEMSVRSRKCLERLNIGTVGDLVKCTEAELLGCKNFGMTSLTEIKQSLKEHGFSLRRLED